MKILYLGSSSSSSTAYHRSQALERLGHEVCLHDPYKEFSDVLSSRFWGKVHYRTGYILLQNKVKKWINKLNDSTTDIDVIWINGGELFGPEALKQLKKLNCPLVLYNNDDPTGGRDGNRFNSLLKGISEYDLCAVLRDENISEYYALGAKKVIRVFMSYDELMHKPLEFSDNSIDKFQSDVVFVGTWMRGENRDSFILQLLKSGVPVSIYGNSWKNSPLFDELKLAYKGPAVYNKDYVAAIQSSKICLGFLSKGNRDLHTRRSVEVPFIGGLFCAERTSEHSSLYQEGEEAVFWSNADECAHICKNLLNDEARMSKIKLAGMKKVRELGVGNEDICRKILNSI